MIFPAFRGHPASAHPTTPKPGRRKTSARPFSGLAIAVPAWLLMTAGAAHAQTAHPGSRVAMSDSFREVAAAGAAADSSHAEIARDTLTADESGAPLRIELVLKMRHYAELERRVAAGETISRAEMAARFLPDAKDYHAVVQWLTAQGLTVSNEAGASHTVVSATGTPTLLQQAFQARFARVKVRGEEFTAAVAPPTLPAELEAVVRSVHGLQPYLHPHKSVMRPKPELVTATGQPPFLVSDITKAYGISGTNLTGAGQTIGIVIDTVPQNNDLVAFWQANGINQSLSNIVTVNTTGRAVTPPTGEETIDVSWSSGIAPGAQIVVYACGDLNFVNSDYSQILDDLQSGARPNLHQISMSFGGGEQADESAGDMNSVHQMYTAMSAYGVSLFAASGDNGPYGAGNESVQVLYPASDPAVTGVGGTTLYLSGTDAVVSESAWSASPDTAKNADNQGSTGGGYSQFFARPSWQTGTGVPSGTMRCVPDVAFAADPNTGCYLVFRGNVQQDGGTSWGTPCWAAMCALINQERAARGVAALAGANPSLYGQMGSASFRDITSGDNYLYRAGTGYDLVTGIGVPNFTALLDSLSGSVPAFFNGETALSNGVYYLTFPNNNYFGYYSFLSNPSYIYHFDLGYEYVFDAEDGKGGIYFYDFASSDFFYTSPTFPFPYLYDFNLKSVLYYYPDTKNAGHYTTNPRFFFNYATGQIISK